MTSPALLVLFLAHVCSIFGTTSDPTADYDNKLTQSKMGYTSHHNRLNRWTNNNLDESNSEFYVNNDLKTSKEYDEIYNEETEVSSLNINNMNLKLRNEESLRTFDERTVIKQRRKRETEDEKCALFSNIDSYIHHPHEKKNKTYYKNADCVTVVTAPDKGQVIQLTFVDEFQIEYHADCKYDYLEIRDGQQGYSKLLGKLCGSVFPSVIQTSGPYAWLKFSSDDTIEYNGFKIHVDYITGPSQSVPQSCYFFETKKTFGNIGIKTISEECRKDSVDLDVLWTIETDVNTKIYLNFTAFKLDKPNECETNVIEVFGFKAEMNYRLVQYCGSIANPISTKDEKENSGKGPGHKMHVRLYMAATAISNKTQFSATYVAYRSLNPSIVEEKCDPTTEFDCDDNTCIDVALRCNGEAHCRLKTDEDPDKCFIKAANEIGQTHIIVILVIFSLILSAMSFVFLYKCIKKLYDDHKIIKEHIRESCEDRLDALSSRLTLDAKRLQRDSEPRASLERENRANEMYKRHRDSFSKRKPSSIDSDYIQETHLDIEEEPWRREVESIPESGDVRIERNGRTRRSEKERPERRERSERHDRHEKHDRHAQERLSERKSDMSKKEESIRSKRESEEKEKKEIRDASVGPPDTKDSGCQTRESLFQADPAPSSDGSGTTGTNSRGFSTFGYSGATIARPSPPAANTSEITIELLRSVPRQDTVKPLKKIDRRPISTETTRSAPDVIIVSKPIR